MRGHPDVSVRHLLDVIFLKDVQCDNPSEDAAAQGVLWKNLNTIMTKHSILEPNFKEFMADSA
jgi:hypothetical protein